MWNHDPMHQGGRSRQHWKDMVRLENEVHFYGEMTMDAVILLETGVMRNSVSGDLRVFQTQKYRRLNCQGLCFLDTNRALLGDSEPRGLFDRYRALS